MSFFSYLQGIKPRGGETETLSNYDEYLRKKDGKLKVKEDVSAINVQSPRSFRDIEELIKGLKSAEGVIVDLRHAPPGEGQRYLDFLSGAAFALSGTVERLQNKMFLFAPKGVQILVNQKEKSECKRNSTQKS